MIDIQHVMKYARRTENPRVGGSIPPLGTIHLVEIARYYPLGNLRQFGTDSVHRTHENRHSPGPHPFRFYRRSGVNGRKRSYGQQKRWLWNSGKRACVYCGCKLTITPGHRNSMTLEHLVPLSRGGYNKRSNYAPACRGCNQGKGAATVTEFENNIFVK